MMNKLPLPKLDIIQHRLTIEQKLGEVRLEHDKTLDKLESLRQDANNYISMLSIIENNPCYFYEILNKYRNAEKELIAQFGGIPTIDNHRFYRL